MEGKLPKGGKLLSKCSISQVSICNYLITPISDVNPKYILIAQVMTAFAKAEKKLKPRWQEMFTDVYHDVPPHLK